MYKYKFWSSSCISRIRNKRVITYFNFRARFETKRKKKYETRNVTEKERKMNKK